MASKYAVLQLVDEVMYVNDVIAGYLGFAFVKTYSKTRSCYYWKGMFLMTFNIGIARGGSRMRGAPGTLVFASHLHPYPEVRVCATNIFTGSDIVAATIFCFVNGRCHHYTSSTCVSSEI